MSLGWFDCPEPSLATSLQGKHSACAGCFCLSSGWFKHLEPHRTFSNHSITDIARFGEFFHMSSKWFDAMLPLFDNNEEVLKAFKHHSAPEDHAIKSDIVELQEIVDGIKKRRKHTI